MILFNSDYLCGAHPDVMQRLVETNMEQTTGYGEDDYCRRAAEKVREICAAPDADVHFLVGGTQTNTTVIASVLRPYQGVLAPHAGHIACHETGAIEATGHKVLAVDCPDGKLHAEQVKAACDEHWNDPTHEHIVQPAMAYISYPTESGMLYSKEELTALYAVCRDRDICLYIDGARLSYGLTSAACDLTLPELARLCDVFYIGGTKTGTLFGEAVVIMNPALKKDFRYFIKRQGGMLAKGRLLGVQFEALFKDDLYLKIAKHANDLADEIRRAFVEKGISFSFDSPTNQLFPILTREQIAALEKEFVFAPWSKWDETHEVVRFCTSWATTADEVRALCAAIRAL